jgi:hypothetical protein
MIRVIPIDPADRAQQRITARGDAEAEEELVYCTSALTESLKTVAAAFPGCTGFGAIERGRSGGVVVLSGSADGPLCSRVAPDRMETWARLIAGLPPGLKFYFDSYYRIASLKADHANQSPQGGTP